MNAHIEESRLNDYVDGELSFAERSAVETHAATCASCRAALERLQALRASVAALPREVAPPPELLARVHERIADMPATVWYARPRILAAAAVLLVMLSSGTTALLLRRGPATPTAVAPAAASPSAALVAVQALERSYEDAIAQLQRAVTEQQNELAPETLRVLRTNLDVIDRAVAEARAALHADPANTALADLLRSGYERKLDVLRSVSAHARGRS